MPEPDDPGHRPPFNVLRACFWLLATVATVQVIGSLGAGVLCWWGNITVFKQPNYCMPLDQLIREIWEQILVAVLALLVARSPPQ